MLDIEVAGIEMLNLLLYRCNWFGALTIPKLGGEVQIIPAYEILEGLSKMMKITWKYHTRS